MKHLQAPLLAHVLGCVSRMAMYGSPSSASFVLRYAHVRSWVRVPPCSTYIRTTCDTRINWVFCDARLFREPLCTITSTYYTYYYIKAAHPEDLVRKFSPRSLRYHRNNEIFYRHWYNLFSRSFKDTLKIYSLDICTCCLLQSSAKYSSLARIRSRQNSVAKFKVKFAKVKCEI